MLFYLPWIYQPSRVYSCKIRDDANANAIDIIRDWVVNQKSLRKTSAQWWYNELPENIHSNFLKIANCDNIIDMFVNQLGHHYRIDILDDMNEICAYTQADKIFNVRHIDGAYFYTPFASCYRVIVGLDNNNMISMVFNLIPEIHTLKKCDVVAFDFHRECHYIRAPSPSQAPDNDDDALCVILKIHYCVYPWWAHYIGKLLGFLSIKYRWCYMNIFPNDAYHNLPPSCIALFINMYHDIEFYIGYNNICYVVLLYILAPNYYIFSLGISFVHYLRWINSVSNNCNNLILQRDYNFYNSLYTCQLLYLYYNYGNIDNAFLFITNMITISYVLPVTYVIALFQYFMLLSLFDTYYPFSMLNCYIGAHLIFNAIEYNYRMY